MKRGKTWASIAEKLPHLSATSTSTSNNITCMLMCNSGIINISIQQFHYVQCVSAITGGTLSNLAHFHRHMFCKVFNVVVDVPVA